MSRQRSMEAILASEYVTIGELVRLTGARYSTLKFYTDGGEFAAETGAFELFAGGNSKDSLKADFELID